MLNWLGLIASIVYIALIVGLAMFCYKKKRFTQEECRKFIHIGLCNWWLIAWLLFDSYIFACIIPGIFVIINYCNYRFNFLKGMEPAEKKRTMGTVWYAIALFLLSIIFFKNSAYMHIGALAILILGYGDGLAGLIGTHFGKKEFDMGGKTVAGSLTIFLVSFFLSVVLLQNLYPAEQVATFALYISVFATIVELFSVKGLDNLTIPLGVAFYAFLLLQYTSWFGPIALAFTITSVIIFLVMARRSLTPAAGFCALLLGTAIYVLAGPVAYGALILFYLTSIMVEHYHKTPLKERQRNLSQVQENGLAALLFSLMYAFTGSEIALTAIFVSIAGATADTWSSGIGYYSKERVKSILTGKQVPKGESGGVTKLGTLAAFLGALLIAGFSVLAPGGNMIIRFILVLFFGMFTSVLDSIFGVFLQAKYYDKEKGLLLETKPKEKKNIEKVSGYHFLTNGMVNFITIMISSILCCLVSLLLF